jgi:hypothetical protein
MALMAGVKSARSALFEKADGKARPMQAVYGASENQGKPQRLTQGVAGEKRRT